jgi:3-hydroxyacyl-CoA dehydrogenase
MTEPRAEDLPDRPTIGIAGSGNIACGLAVACAPHLEVRLHARSAASAERARGTMARMAKRAPGGEQVDARVALVPELTDLADSTVLAEAVAEDIEIKGDVLRSLAALPGSAPLVTTTSSLPLTELAHASGAPDRVAAVHLFSPVYQVPLAELAFPEEADAATRTTVRALCDAIGKTVVEVPGVPGFVVNRVVFPMLMAAVETLELTGLEPEALDEAMRLALGHPLGPLRTLDFIGIDVAIAIAERLELKVPGRLREMAAAGTLGRKSGEGFFSYRG